MTAYIQNAEGANISKELLGAQCLEDREAAWDFAAVGFEMGGFIDRGVADAYKAFPHENGAELPLSMLARVPG